MGRRDRMGGGTGWEEGQDGRRDRMGGGKRWGGGTGWEEERNGEEGQDGRRKGMGRRDRMGGGSNTCSNEAWASYPWAGHPVHTQLTISSTWPSLRLDPPCVLSVTTEN